MKQQLEVLAQALNKANLAGAFTLEEASLVSNTLGQVGQSLVNLSKQIDDLKKAAADKEETKIDGEEQKVRPRKKPKKEEV